MVTPTIGSNNLTSLSKAELQELSLLLGADDFSIGKYLNKALNVSSKQEEVVDVKEKEIKEADLEKVERRMHEIALSLQLETQSCHDEIGRIGAELQAILPRCAADINRLDAGLHGMKQDVSSLMGIDQMKKNPATATSITKGASTISDINTMKTLSTLHSLQTNLEFTKGILQATSHWDSTLSSIPSLLSEQKLSQAVTALTHLQQGARALRGMPGKDQREQTVQKFKTQIETLLKPQLLHAFANIENRVNLLHQTYEMYQQLNNTSDFLEEYVKNRPATLQKGWFSYAPSVSAVAQQTPTTTTVGNSSIISSNNKPSFNEFLSQWYDSILALLAEERRRTQTVFKEKAPYVTASILRETFRPLLPSFETRLNSICSAKSSVASSEGSFTDIYKAYEQTLTFLSMAYDHISSSSSSKSNTKAHSELIEEIYVTIVSPFLTHQLQYAILEYNNIQLQQGKLANDIQTAVRSLTNSANSNSLTLLENSIEKLDELAVSIFPMAQDGISRFMLMNCGYNTNKFLAQIDNLLSSHTNELSIAINTLSASTSNNTNNNKKTSIYDETGEQHVQFALEVLKTTGKYKHQLKDFESSLITSLKNCLTKIRLFSTSETSWSIFDNTTTGSSSLMTDQLCIAIASAVINGRSGDKNHQSKETIQYLHRIISSSSSQSQQQQQETNNNLLPKVYNSMTQLSQSSHTFVFDVCTAVPQKYLIPMSSLDTWTKTETDDLNNNTSFTEHILPQSYITQVGEHMLSLVHELEPFASSKEALFFANQVMGKKSLIKRTSMKTWKHFVTAASSSISSSEEDTIGGKRMVKTDNSDLFHLMDGKEFYNSVLSCNFDVSGVQDSILFAQPPHDDDEEEDDEIHEDASADDRASAAFCNEWLDVIGSAVTGWLLERILRIHRLSDLGAKHLAADLNYIINVFSALGISLHPLLKHVETLVSMDDMDEFETRIYTVKESILTKLKKKDNDDDMLLKEEVSDALKVLLGVEQRILKLRGK